MGTSTQHALSGESVSQSAQSVWGYERYIATPHVCTLYPFPRRPRVQIAELKKRAKEKFTALNGTLRQLGLHVPEDGAQGPGPQREGFGEQRQLWQLESLTQHAAKAFGIEETASAEEVRDRMGASGNRMSELLESADELKLSCQKRLDEAVEVRETQPRKPHGKIFRTASLPCTTR